MTEDIAVRELSLPIHPLLTDEQITSVADVLKQLVGATEPESISIG